MRTGALAAIAAAGTLATGTARAADVGSLGGSPVKLDATDTSIVAQHFDYRTCTTQVPGPTGGLVNTVGPCEKPQDSGWGQWLNRLNAALRWDQTRDAVSAIGIVADAGRGVLAVRMPAMHDAPQRALQNEVTARGPWASHLRSR